VTFRFALKVENAAKEWNGQEIFKNVSFNVMVGERVSLIGRNGVGKTSLLNAVVGKTEFDAGSIERHIPLHQWGWIEQEVRVPEGVSLFDFVFSARVEMHRLKQKMEVLQQEMGKPEDTGRPSTPSDDLADYLQILDEYTSQGGYDYERQVEITLKQFGFQDSHLDVAYNQLSGGQKTRAQVARLAVTSPQFLLLDEPTNHLDSETMNWLETWLKTYRGSVLFVSHDRHFIDALADTTYELTPTGANRYKGGYTAFRVARDLEIKTQLALYERQQRERRELQEAIQRYKEWYERAHNSASERDVTAKKKAEKNSTRFKAKQQSLARLEAMQVKRPQTGFHADVAFEEGAFQGKVLLRMEGVNFSYPGRSMFRNIRLEVTRGDRIGVIGSNGSGKSTLLRLATGQLTPEKGTVTLNPQTRIGYFAQELRDLDEKQTVLDTVLTLPNMTATYARTVLAGFLFRREDVFKPIAALSLGERCRVALVKLYFSNANLLVLDEPTNFLDIDTRERLEDALLDYPGALIIVSHDRYLLRKVVNRVVSIERMAAGIPSEDMAVRIFEGTLDEFSARANGENVDTTVQNELNRLELELIQLMALEARGEDNRRVMVEIRSIRSKLDALREQL